MKVFAVFGALVLLFSGVFAQGTYDKSNECGCDFSSYKPTRLSHFLNMAVKKVEPGYPPAAKSVGVYGKVVVKILVDRKGDVVETCVVEGHPLLGAASVQAAKGWKFKKNFGLTSQYKPKVRYIEEDLTFNFRQP